jgi:hypothetical protein
MRAPEPSILLNRRNKDSFVIMARINLNQAPKQTGDRKRAGRK